ncbi:MAG: hypothetical protein ACK55I_33540, partial [bacterium]
MPKPCSSSAFSEYMRPVRPDFSLNSRRVFSGSWAMLASSQGLAFGTSLWTCRRRQPARDRACGRGAGTGRRSGTHPPSIRRRARAVSASGWRSHRLPGPPGPGSGRPGRPGPRALPPATRAD